MKKYDIFLFDADGTLYDYDKAEAHALKAMFDYCGFNYSEGIRTKYRKINTQAWESYEKGEISKGDLQINRFVSLFNEIDVQYDAKKFNEKYLLELGKGAFLIDGALEICKAITSCNKQIFVVTNGILATQEARIKHSLIEKYITDFFVSEFVGYQKPDERYFEYVFSHIPAAWTSSCKYEGSPYLEKPAPQLEKDKILIVGDSLSADIAGGNKAGIDSCWFNEHGKENHTGILPTYEINSLHELQKFI